MNEFDKLVKALEGACVEADKFYDKGNKAAGTRLRLAMLEIKKLAQAVRVEVTAIKEK